MTVQGAAESANARLREALSRLSAKFSAERRGDRGLDNTLYFLYAAECFLHALASTPRGRDFVLKGGNLFRIWQGMDSFRPTGDLDMQCRDAARSFHDGRDLRREVASVVCTEAFRGVTGLVFPLDTFRLEPIRKGAPIAYRLEGKVFPGDPGTGDRRPAGIPFCLEVSYGPPPDGAVALSQWESIMVNGPSFDLPASRPEWMAAEKFHSVVTRGAANSRLKDYRDLFVLMGQPAFDDQLMRGCVRQVFAEPGQEHLIPLSASGLATLSPAFATSHNEYLWQRRRWPEWEGREWDSNGDPTLAEAVAVIVVQLERRGLLAVTRASGAAAALADLCRAAAALDANGLSPLVSARFATALKTLAPIAGEADPGELALRWHGVARTAGLPGISAAGAFDQAMAVAARMGITRAIDRGWNRGQGAGSEAVALVRATLMKAPGRTMTAAERQPAVTCAPARIAGAAAAAPKAGRKSRAAPQKNPDDLMAEGIHLLAEGRPGTHVWFGGLARVLAAAGAAVPPLEPGFVGMPTDSRAPFIWLHIAGKQNLEPDLSRAVAMACEILDTGAPAFAMAN